jgi:2-keto-4-pentenoate hydratase/2-oxohepta-3-ene-1,7-dioic acid hydratase in catechol pathway
MLWMRFLLDGRPALGQLDGGQVLVHEGSLFDAPRPTGRTVPLEGLQWLAPCEPGKFICLWNNFHAAAAKQGQAIPAEPLWVIKAATALSAHQAPIVAPAPAVYDGRVVFEGELGVVIGRRCRHVDAEQAAEHILGYTCVNDVTALELIGRDPAFAQWTRAKSFDGFGPFGPVIATGLDPLALTVRTLVGGRERQNYPVSDMIFPPAQIVARLSREMTLEPGDVISCGTSLGVLPMRPGQRVEVVIDGIGTLSNEYQAAAA